MRKKIHVPGAILVVVLVAAIACRTVPPAEPPTRTPTEAANSTSEAPDDEEPSPAAGGFELQPTPTRPVVLSPTPTAIPAPTRISVADWQTLGDETMALGISAPTDWVDFSGRLDVATAANPRGLIVLLAADSERTGSSVLAGKEIASGAFIVGMIASVGQPAADPLQTLTNFVSSNGLANGVITEPSPVRVPLPTITSRPVPMGDLTGASIDVTGDPAGFYAPGDVSLRTRINIFPISQGNGSLTKDAQAIFLMSASAREWSKYEGIFGAMVSTTMVYSIDAGFSISDGSAAIVGDLQEMEPADGRLSPGVRDLWAFETVGAEYVTLKLTSIDQDADLLMRVIGPDGLTLSEIDTGYAGNAEILADLYLPAAGVYIVEVGEYLQGPGRYALTLIMHPESLAGNMGRIEAGQGVQSEIRGKDRHRWTFEGTAGQQISVVLRPTNEQFDAILELFDPEGNELLELDEGFSGDAEVISGYELPVTGEYTIRLYSFADNGGIYTLTLDEGGELTQNFFDAGDVTDGDVRQESLRPQEAHAWFFEGRVGDLIAAKVTPLDPALDLDLWLLDPLVRRLAAVDAFAAGEAETVEAEVQQDGQYVLLVREFFGEPGDYEIRFASTSANTPDQAGLIRYGDTITGTLRQDHSVVWQFNGDVDDVIDISLIPLNSDADLEFLLQDPDARTVTVIDSGTAGQPEALTGFTVTTDGLWRIVVKEFFGDGGAYRLTVGRTPPLMP